MPGAHFGGLPGCRRVPKGQGDPAYEVIDTVELYKYRPYAPGGSKFSFVAEYAYSFLATAWTTLKARRSGRFAVIQACNPPDIFWPLAMAFRAVEGTRFVFDHHDLCPSCTNLVSLVARSFPTRDCGPLSAGPTGPPIMSSPPMIPIARSRDAERQRPADVTVVRTGPDPQRLSRGEADPELRRGRRYLVAYIGVMGPQDGVDIVVRAADIVVHKLGRDDIAFTLIGSGDCFDDLVACVTNSAWPITWSSPGGRRTSSSRAFCRPRTWAFRRTRRIRSMTCRR